MEDKEKKRAIWDAFTEDEKLTAIERARTRPGTTRQTIAEEYGIVIDTVDYYLKKLRAEKRIIKQEIPTSTALRSAALERTFNTHDTVVRFIEKVERVVDKLENLLEEGGSAYENKEGILVVKDDTAQRYAAYFKGIEAAKGQLELMGKLLGQITDQRIVIDQADHDVELVLRTFFALNTLGSDLVSSLKEEFPEAVERLQLSLPPHEYERFMRRIEGSGEALARQMYNELVAEDERRRRRMGAVLDYAPPREPAIEGEWKEVG